MDPVFQAFTEQVLDAQIKADQTNTGVTVGFQRQSTFVEPNLPKLTKKEIWKRFSTMQQAEQEMLSQESFSILDKKNYPPCKGIFINILKKYIKFI